MSLALVLDSDADASTVTAADVLDDPGLTMNYIESGELHLVLAIELWRLRDEERGRHLDSLLARAYGENRTFGPQLVREVTASLDDLWSWLRAEVAELVEVVDDQWVIRAERRPLFAERAPELLAPAKDGRRPAIVEKLAALREVRTLFQSAQRFGGRIVIE
jgi:hypothetical protein